MTPPARSRVRPTPASVSTKGGLRVEKATFSGLGFSGRGPHPLLGILPTRSPSQPGGRSHPARILAPPLPSPCLCPDSPLAERPRVSEPGAAWPRVTAWVGGGEGRGGRGVERHCGLGLRARWPRGLDRAAGAAGSFLAVGDGLRCLCPGTCLDPGGRGDHPAAAGDRQPARGVGFRPDRAAAVSELPGQRASEPGASRSPGPRRLPLCPLCSPLRSGPAALVVGLPVESPAWGDMPEFGSAVSLSLPSHPGKQAC